jgi:PAS domain S-box-containing protein
MPDKAESYRHGASGDSRDAPGAAAHWKCVRRMSPMTTVTLASVLTIVLMSGLGWQAWRSYLDHKGVHERAFKVEDLRDQIVYSDEVLTMSANMAAATGDPRWEMRYREFEPKLDTAIKRLRDLVPEKFDSKAAAQTDQANIKLVEMENRVFEMVARGRGDEAQRLLAGDQYRRQKKLYSDGMKRITSDVRDEVASDIETHRKRALVAIISVLSGVPLLSMMWLWVLRDMKRYLQERRQAEGALRESEERFRSLVGNIPGAVYRYQTMHPWAMEHVSEAVFKITGHHAKDFMERKIPGIGALIADEDVENVKSLVAEAIAARSPFDLTYRIRYADGGVRWVHDTGRPVYGRDDKPLWLDGVMLDVTESKQTERQLRQIEWLLTKRPPSQLPSRESYRESYGDLAELNTSRVILDSVGKEMLADIAKDYMDMLGTSCAVYEKNGDYALGFFASGWCSMLDTASRRLCGADDNACAMQCGRWLCHESCWTDVSRTAIETGNPADTECNGGIRLYAVPIHAGDEIVGAINFGYGDPPKDAQKLQEVADRYMLDPDTLRKESEAYESRPAFIIDIAKERLQTSAKLIGAIVERRMAERERERLLKSLEAKNEELQSIVYVASHDLKSPLVNIRGFSGELAAACEQIEGILHGEEAPPEIQHRLATVLDEDIPQAIGFIRAGTSKMEALLHGLLQVSRVGTAALTPRAIDMNEMMDHILAGMQFQINESGAAVIVDSLPDCIGDDCLVNQVLTNLLDNAVKYLDPDRKGRVHVSGRVEGGVSIYCVEDNGIGIAPQHLPKVFELFHRLEPTGAVPGEGLGLTITRRILDRLGGKIWVESETQKGSRFFLSLLRE